MNAIVRLPLRVALNRVAILVIRQASRPEGRDSRSPSSAERVRVGPAERLDRVAVLEHDLASPEVKAVGRERLQSPRQRFRLHSDARGELPFRKRDFGDRVRALPRRKAGGGRGASRCDGLRHLRSRMILSASRHWPAMIRAMLQRQLRRAARLAPERVGVHGEEPGGRQGSRGDEKRFLEQRRRRHRDVARRHDQRRIFMAFVGAGQIDDAAEDDVHVLRDLVPR